MLLDRSNAHRSAFTEDRSYQSVPDGFAKLERTSEKLFDNSQGKLHQAMNG